MDTLELANDYVNPSWEEFEENIRRFFPEVMDYLYENRDHRELWKGVPISRDGKVSFVTVVPESISTARNNWTHALSETASSG